MATKLIEIQDYAGRLAGDVSIDKRGDDSATGAATVASLVPLTTTGALRYYLLTVTGDPLGLWAVNTQTATRPVEFVSAGDEEFWIGQAAASESALTGPNTITITVQDDDTDEPIEAALVRMYRTGATESKRTNASGEQSFAVESATWSIATQAAGYVSDVQTLAITGDTALVIELTATSITPPGSSDMSTLQVLAVDGDGEPEEGVEIHVRLAAMPSTSTGLAAPGAQRTKTSPANGVVEFACHKLATYQVRRGDSKAWTDVVIADADSTLVKSFVGGA